MSQSVHVQNTLLANKFYRTYCEKSNPIYIILVQTTILLYNNLPKSRKGNTLGRRKCFTFFTFEIFQFLLSLKIPTNGKLCFKR